MNEKVIFNQEELVLRVNPNYDPEKLDFSSWMQFIDRLCGDREYQKIAIKQSIIFLASGRYCSIEELIKENYPKNNEMQKKYTSIEDYNEDLQMKGKLFATIDLATGTGKSYVIYAVAQIMLGIGLVDDVLVLCPSVTIEEELTKKFETLSSDVNLKNTIPDYATVKNPRIINANITIKKGDICIENIHAVYEKTGSSIEDSLKGNGERTLVLNDEAHHIFNKVDGKDTESKDIKKWKEFLVSDKYNFNYMLGFTGTAYIENRYFNDVIFRYSLREAIEDGVVKNIEYVQKDDSIDKEEKKQKIYSNHMYSKDKYPSIKPLTIIITKNIKSAKALRNEFIDFLCDKEKIIEKDAEKKVLVVTSDKEHKKNIPLLKLVDNKENPVEWIISVAMLTEGWDVKNVFQIVPWEDKAFNSKLLIAQVLGRGLRLPEEYKNPQPKVVVFNHDAWSRNIKELVKEILEVDIKITSRVMMRGNRSKYNFELYNFDYKREETEVYTEDSGEVFNFSRLEEVGIKLESQVLSQEKVSVFENFIYNTPREKNYIIEYKSRSIDEVVESLYREFEIRNWEGKVLKLTNADYTQDNLPPKATIKEIIVKSMEKVGIKGDRINEKNANRILNSFSTILRKTSKKVVQNVVFEKPYCVSTQNMSSYSYGISGFMHGNSLFYSSDWIDEVNNKEQEKIMKYLIEDDMLPKRATKEVNTYIFKTPLELVVTSQNPEMLFVEQLCKEKNAKLINSWIKSRDRGFYSIQYSLKYGGKDSKTRSYSHKQFNPDFFVKVSKENDKLEYILVVETKTDGDVSDENIAKYKAGKRHFEELNLKLSKHGIKQKYIFHFLSPNGYAAFFEYLKNGKLLESQEVFRCELEYSLEVSDE